MTISTNAFADNSNVFRPKNSLDFAQIRVVNFLLELDRASAIWPNNLSEILRIFARTAWRTLGIRLNCLSPKLQGHTGRYKNG